MRTILLQLFIAILPAAIAAQPAGDDYKNSQEYLRLRDSVHHAFNTGDSLRFFRSITNLENYLALEGDIHAYYTQRCNEIVFEMNRDRIYEAYKLATQLSRELTEKGLDKEMYMAINMMGHIDRYCGNKESAKRCFRDVLRRMEKEGYRESMPPIYMNLVNIVMAEDTAEAMRLIDKALAIAGQTSPERVFDIKARRTLAYYEMGDAKRFMEGYRFYKDGESKGLSSVHGRKLEVYYLALQGKTDEAIRLSEQVGDSHYETQAEILSRAGRWQEAFQKLKLGAAESDSINSLILANSMRGIHDELAVYEARQHTARLWFFGLAVVISLLLLLIAAMTYIVHSRRRHLKELRKAYQQVLEADRMKTEFIKNVSHEVRTPLNIISGYAQIIANPDYEVTAEERSNMSETIAHNTQIITTMVNEVLEMSAGDVRLSAIETTETPCNRLVKDIVAGYVGSAGIGDDVVTVDSSLDDSQTIVSNEHMVTSALQPLLDNGVKNMSPTGGRVTVGLTVDGGRLHISVTDNGSGISESDADRVFELFVKLDKFKEGVGLGLPFSRVMARRLGGDVRLDTSHHGPGARFVLTLPLKL